MIHVPIPKNLCAESFDFVLFCIYEKPPENLLSWSMLKQGLFTFLLRSTDYEKLPSPSHFF